MASCALVSDGTAVHLRQPVSRKGLAGIGAVLVILLTSNSRAFQVLTADLPAPGNNRVAYYAFDATPVGQGIYPLTTFTDKANIVVVFEGTLWELADSVHYSSGWMKNAYYKYYSQILSDIKTLQARGVKVLMNVDDTKSWSTDTVFTTYDGTRLNYQQFASFIDTCITKIGLDGIALDIEHGATDNTNYRNLIKEIGKYVGPLSTSYSTSRIYTAAIYLSSYGVPGPTVIGWDRTIAAYLNFVMDMGYFQNNNIRFHRWADSLGNGKVMDGFSHDDPNNSLSVAAAWAAWHPTPDKAGVMVFAGNVNKPYTDSVFAALEAPDLATNPNPANNATGVSRVLTLSWTTGFGVTSCDVYFGTSNPPESKGNQTTTTYNPVVLAQNTTYYWRIDEKNSSSTTAGPVWSFTTDTDSTTSVERTDAEGIPQKFALMQNYPNPFNPTTAISYELSKNGFVTLRVYDALGREIRTLVDGSEAAGKHSVNFDGDQLPSGIYFYRLTASGNSYVKKMVLIR